MAQNTTLYLKIDKNIEVNHKDIYLKDIASLECTDKEVLNKVKTIKILKVSGEKNIRYVISILKIIELIHEQNASLDVQNMGETDFIITYEHPKSQKKAVEFLKIILVCLVTFFGAAFSIMAFNNDVAVNDLFGKIYEAVTGAQSNGFTVLEASYSIGLVIGIIVFFNHVGKRKLSVDPTPMEVEMRLYEDDINSTLVEAYTREETFIDVGDKTISGNSGD